MRGQRPLLTLPQLIALLLVLVILFFAVNLTRRANAGQIVGSNEAILEQQVAVESTRQVELQATLSYVQSEDYVADYARNEGGYIQPGDQRIVPLVVEAATPAAPAAAATPDPALAARPWQAWWRLLTDAPFPSRQSQ